MKGSLIDKISRSAENVNKVQQIDSLAQVLSKQIDKDIFERKYAPVKEILKIIGVGVFMVGALAVPNLPLVLKPFLEKERKTNMKFGRGLIFLTLKEPFKD